MLAGRISDELKSEIKSISNEKMRLHVHCHFANVPEEEVSTFYFASSFYVAPYKAWFKVSSGTITRAFAASVPVITASHGVNGELIVRNGAGIVFDAVKGRGAASLKAAMEQAYDVFMNNHEKWELMSQKSGILGEGRVLSCFCGHLSL